MKKYFLLSLCLSCLLSFIARADELLNDAPYLHFVEMINAIENMEPQPRLDIFSEKGECVTTSILEVTDVLENGALAHIPYDVHNWRNLRVFILKEQGKIYYDNQRIAIPQGKCARLWGVFKYGESDIPAVKIESAK